MVEALSSGRGWGIGPLRYSSRLPQAGRAVHRRAQLRATGEALTSLTGCPSFGPFSTLSNSFE
jgi:hypothetical protein